METILRRESTEHDPNDAEAIVHEEAGNEAHNVLPVFMQLANVEQWKMIRYKRGILISANKSYIGYDTHLSIRGQHMQSARLRL